MIKNSWRVRLTLLGLTLGLATSCGGQRSRHPPDAYQGVIELEERVLSFEVAGRVADVKVQRGQTARAGTVYAELDTELQAAIVNVRDKEVGVAAAQLSVVRAGPRSEEIRATRARLSAAKKSERVARHELGRMRELVASGFTAAAQVERAEGEVSRAKAERQALEEQLKGLQRGARAQELDTAEAGRDAAKAMLELEKLRMKRHVLEAQRGGEVLDIHVEEGEVVAAGHPIVTVADAKRPYAEVFVPQGELPGISVGSKASVSLDGEGERFTGRVEWIKQRTEFTPRFLFSEEERPNLVIRVRVRIDDPQQRLHAGVPAFVVIERTTAVR